jgi:DNA-binding HxlR family transcriptional regulator
MSRPVPLPGQPVRGSTTGRPIMALLDLLGRRWALRILWELRLAPASFQALQARCDSMSTSVLSQRLGELRDAQLVGKDEAGRYCLTEPGTRLLARLDGMDEWTQEWARRLGRPTAEDRGGPR